MEHFEVKTNDIVGRYAVANKDLKQGETIFTEVPFAYGPKSDTYAICLGCYTPVDCATVCSACKWPVCDANCEKMPAHRDMECQVFQKANVVFHPVDDPSVSCPQFECVTPLRVLLMKEKEPKRWQEEVACMESHMEEIKNKPIWNYYQVNVVEFLKDKCKLEERFDESLIQTVCCMLDVNAFEARTMSGYLIRCLYPKLAILSHNCVSNISHSIFTTGDGTEKDYSVTVRATIDLRTGDELYSSYTYSLWPTIVRRHCLRETKYFDCKCSRCADPTELGTHMSTLKCTKCDNGVIMSGAPLDAESVWKCTHCEFATSSGAVKKAFDTIQAEIDAVDEMEQDAGALEAREQLFRKYRSILHPRNAYNTILKVSLGQMYGKVPGYTLDDLPDLLYERKAEMCQQVLDNLNVIEPGYTRIRGITLYELHVPLIFLARNLASTNSIDKDQLRKKLEAIIKMLEESATILELEPPTSSEGMLGQVARQSLNQLKDNMEELIEGSFM